MKAFAISLGMALAVAGCTVQSDEDQLEGAIRNQLESQGNVLDVQMTRQDDNNINGFADIRDNGGNEGRLNCTAHRTEGSNYQFNCLPAITDREVQQMEANMRNMLAPQGEVLEVDLTRQDDMRMTGFARLRGPDGAEVRTNCAATRENPTSRNFSMECNPGEGGGAEAGK